MQDSLDPRDVVRQPATDAARPAQQAEPTIDMLELAHDLAVTR